MANERGSALVTVILVVLVLTMVGLAALLFMTVEDTISGNDRYQKEALYLAEVGLREGELRMGDPPGGGIDELLQYTHAANDVPLSLDDCVGYQYLGTVLTDTAGQPLYNVAVQYMGAGGSVDRTGFYSVYIRNNRQDGAGSATLDADGYVDILSVGTVQDPNGRILFQKILAEEFFLGQAGSGQVLQKGVTAGGTGSATYD